MNSGLTIIMSVLVLIAAGVLAGALHYRMWGHVALNASSIIVGVATIAMLHS